MFLVNPDELYERLQRALLACREEGVLIAAWHLTDFRIYITRFSNAERTVSDALKEINKPPHPGR